MSHGIRFFLIAWLAAGLASFVGCASSGSSAAAAPSGDEQGKLMTVLQGYQLPAQSIAPTVNPDQDVQRAIVRMSQIAQSQGLVFDGSRARDGIVVVGKQGSSGPILLALSIYKKQGRVAMQDTSFAKGMDFREGMQMKERFLNEL